ncbi:MAG: hypothetical protein GXO12_07020 [Epsilonproteobacteria bacterium]|nr:hypothetical protein [Campylobacterota bacterium]
MDFFEEWMEYDYNPFILFDKNERVIYVNQEAQYLLGYVPSKEIFKIASSYANPTYGYKTTILDLEFDRYSFYGFTVGYKDDEKIGIKLYKKPSKSFELNKKDSTKINIYTIIDLAISSFSTHRQIKHEKIVDPTLPEIYIKVDEFLKLLTKIYTSFQNSENIKTKLSLVTGEYIVYQDKKYGIISIKISGEKRDKSDDENIKKIAFNSNSSVDIKSDTVEVLLPMVL